MSPADDAGKAEYKKAPGPHAVAEALFDWRDQARDRAVPVKVYYPQEGGGPFPVIVFSHGLGGSRETYSYLGRHWASHGYVCVHVQHVGSDESVWKGQTRPMEAMKRALLDPRTTLNRPPDIRFVFDRLEKLQTEDGPLKGRLDLARIGMGGHSFGAFTTLAMAGQVFVTPAGRTLAVGDARIKAAIAMSPNAPTRRDALDRNYAAIRIPILHMTGTRDDSPLGDTRPADRRIPFDHIKAPDQYLLIFKDGDHMVFSGRKRLRGDENNRDQHFQALIRQTTTAFWDAFLKNDLAARRWLREGGCEAVLGQDGTFEKHVAATRPE